ncbi:hypothetical protein [Cellulosilyticum sp. I15G10I2]|uniref:hypothetical protein n=1 Tax=Cellulosilyticum sp. I15G10I2 TaxID=1892843 RepID=UPI00085C114B|nr:hypothetical protein [Cellulosilyticum sp. I15G10I2]
MRRRYLWVLVLILFITSGCTKEKIVTSRLEPLNPEKLSHELRTSIDSYIRSNGIFQIYTSNGHHYLFLNGSTITEGEKLIFFENVKINDDKNIANIYFDELYTSAYQDKELENMKIYEIFLNDAIDTISIYRNGQKTYFDNIIISK